MTFRRRALLLAVPMAALLTLSACSSYLNALTPGNTCTLKQDVPYGPLPRHRLDAYEPLGTPPEGGFPVVVFIHGGSWQDGDRSEYKFLGEALASRGIVVLVANYRLYPEVRYPDFLTDCARAVAHALQDARRYRGNPRRVVVMGHSAGAYNAAMLALDDRWLAARGHQPRELAGWVGLAGPYDFLPLTVRSVQPIFHHPEVPADSQPLAHASAGAPRSFVAVPGFDFQVDPQRNGAQLADRLRSLGVPVVFKRYEALDHLTILGAFARPLRRMAPVLDDVVAFVQATPP